MKPEIEKLIQETKDYVEASKYHQVRLDTKPIHWEVPRKQYSEEELQQQVKVLSQFIRKERVDTFVAYMRSPEAQKPQVRVTHPYCLATFDDIGELFYLTVEDANEYPFFVEGKHFGKPTKKGYWIKGEILRESKLPENVIVQILKQIIPN